MEINLSENYSISRDDERTGPFPGDQLLQMAQDQELFASDYLWCGGMAQWLPADTFSPLKAVFEGDNPTVKPPPTPAGGQSKPQIQSPEPAKTTASSVKNVAQMPAAKTAVKKGKGASFILLMFLGLLFWVALLGPAAAMFIPMDSANLAAPSLLERFFQSEIAQNGVTMSVVVGLMVAALVAFPIMSLVYLYRAWAGIQDVPTVTLSPFAASALTLVPLFNIVWVFIAYIGWAKNYNSRNNLTYSKSAPVVSEALFITHRILALFLLGLFLYPFVMYQMCRGINYLAEAPPIDKQEIETPESGNHRPTRAVDTLAA